MAKTTTESNEPRHPGDKVRQELEKLLDTVWSSSERALDALGLGGLAGKELLPRLDVVETDSSVEVLANLPGVDPGVINISLVGNMLTIAGAFPVRASTSHDVTHRRERPYGEFSRSVPLPCPVNADSVNAVAKDGVLTITLAKPENEKPRQIKIQVKPSGSGPSPPEPPQPGPSTPEPSLETGGDGQ